MTVRRRRSDRSGRSKLHSPGRPDSARREELVRFRAAIATGRSSEDAARDAGVSPPVGSRWFRRSGGMPPSHLSQSAKPLSGRYLSFEERDEIALSGHGAEAVRDAIARTITTLPAQLRRSLTWDQGAEMARHADLRIATGLPVYFCEPHSPWQRGTNENTNGLLRQYFPKGTDLSAHSPDVLAVVADALTRKTLGWRTPAEALDQCLQASQTERVATTG